MELEFDVHVDARYTIICSAILLQRLRGFWEVQQARSALLQA